MERPPAYHFDVVDLTDEKENPRQSKTAKGYHDWEAGAPHDPNHTAIPERIEASPPQRRRVDVSLWHLIALHCSVVFLGAIIVALVVVILTRGHSATHSNTPGTLLTFDASLNTTVTVTHIEPLYSSANKSMQLTASSTTSTDRVTQITTTSTITQPPVIVTEEVGAAPKPVRVTEEVVPAPKRGTVTLSLMKPNPHGTVLGSF
jgi:hypothetical protein